MFRRMAKRELKVKDSLTISKFTAPQLLILSCFFALSLFNTLDLNAQINTNYSSETISDILSDLEKEFNQEFSYCSNCLPLDRECSVQLSGSDLSELLPLLQTNCGIKSRRVGGNWVLRFEEELIQKPQLSSVKKSTEKPIFKKEELLSELQSKILSPGFAKVQLSDEKPELPPKRIPELQLERESAMITIPEFAQEVADLAEEKFTELKEMRNEKKAASELADGQRNADNILVDSGEESLGIDPNNSKAELKKTAKERNEEESAENEKSGNKRTRAAKRKQRKEEKNKRSIDKEKGESDHNSEIENHDEVQVSLLPGIGSNGRNSSTTKSKYSLNLLWGTTGSVSGAEVGVLANSVKENMHGFQLAGLFNKVGKSTKGVQLAGLGNISQGKSEAVQIGGLFNWGEQVKSAQIGGLYNKASGSETESWQVAGLVNNSEGTAHTQVAGIVNKAEEVDGVQVAGIVNIADTVKGLQIGLVNVANDVSGASIGLLSFIKNGYNKVTISSDELFDLNVKLSLGSHAFYNVITFGNNDFKEEYEFGYGIGHHIPLKKKWSMNFETVGSYILEERINLLAPEDNWRLKFAVWLNYELVKKLAITAGPSVSLQWRQTPVDPTGSLEPETYLMSSNTDSSIRTWLGFQIGIQLL